MSYMSAVSVLQRSDSKRSSLTRTALTAAALALFLTSTHIAVAQTPVEQGRKWEFRISGGAFVPTGTQRDVLKDAQISAAQLSWVVRPSVAITGTVGWARSRDLTSPNAPKVDAFSYDLGAEARASEWFAANAVSLTPFVGFGAGVRSYNYRSLDFDATHNAAAYGALGGEVGIGRVGLRLELRDYIAGFKPLIGAGESNMRNDVVVLAALRFNRKHVRVNQGQPR